MNHNVTQRIVNKAWSFAHVLRGHEGMTGTGVEHLSWPAPRGANR